jgi:hypothetical protein
LAITPRVLSQAFCGTTQHQFRDFQILFVKRRFGSRGNVADPADHAKLPSLMQNRLSRPVAKNAAPIGRKIELNARPQIRDHLLARAMQKWALRGRYPSAYPNCRASRARKNFSRLLAKYPHIAQRLGLDAVSAYPPL